MSSEEILARYDNYYSGATDWDTAQQPAHDEHNNAAAAGERELLDGARIDAVCGAGVVRPAGGAARG